MLSQPQHSHLTTARVTEVPAPQNNFFDRPGPRSSPRSRPSPRRPPQPRRPGTGPRLRPPDDGHAAPAAPSDRSRWCTVYSLAHRGTCQIDDIRQRWLGTRSTSSKKTATSTPQNPPSSPGSPPSSTSASTAPHRLDLRHPPPDGSRERSSSSSTSCQPPSHWVIVVRWALRFAQTPLAAVVTVLTCTLGSL